MQLIYLFYFIMFVLLIRFTFLTDKSFKKKIINAFILIGLSACVSWVYLNLDKPLSEVHRFEETSYLSIQVIGYQNNQDYYSDENDTEKTKLLNNKMNAISFSPDIHIFKSGDFKMYGNQMVVFSKTEDKIFSFIVSDSGYIKINNKGVYKLNDTDLYDQILEILNDV